MIIQHESIFFKKKNLLATNECDAMGDIAWQLTLDSISNSYAG